MNVLELLVYALASWRLAHMLAFEDGPFESLKSFRIEIGTYEVDDAGQPFTFLGRLFGCLYCLSIYTSIAVILVPFLVSQVLAVSSLAIILNYLVLAVRMRYEAYEIQTTK